MDPSRLVLVASFAFLVSVGLSVSIATSIAGCRNGDRAGEWKPERTAELYFTTGVSGFVEPCGCTTKPLGGVQRLATVIRRGQADRGLVDAGDLLFPTTGLDDTTRPQHLLKARLLAGVVRSLGAIAINLGASDLAGGVEFMKELQREGAVPFVSANVRPSFESGPAVAQSFLRVLGDVRFGITGVATPENFAGLPSLTAIEYATAVRMEAKLLRSRGAEIVLVLAQVGETEARDLARAVPEIDIIVRSPGAPIERDPTPPERVGSVLVLEAGSQGQHVGRLTVALESAPAPRPIAFDDAAPRELRARGLMERKVKAYRGDADAWRVDPAKADAVKARLEQILRLEAALKEPIASVPRPAGPHVAFELIRLSEDIPGDPDVARLLSHYYAQLKDMNLDRGDVSRCAATRKGDAVYVGTAKCAECHEDAYAFWKKTKHAKAWATLEDQGKHFDLTCIGCHTVGYQRPGGFCRLKNLGVLKDVGCENCHGPGSVHVEDSDPTSIKLEGPESTCKEVCHVPEHSDAFVYEKYVREITGPGHELSEVSVRGR